MVQVLACRSAEASREIRGLIRSRAKQVEAGTALVDRARQPVNELVASTCSLTDIVGKIGAASTEQSKGMEHISEAITQMDQANQQNTALAQKMAAARLKHRAGELVDNVVTVKQPEIYEDRPTRPHHSALRALRGHGPQSMAAG